MRHIAAFDGGGTKTRCVLVNSLGEVQADSLTGPSNHQAIGIEETKNSLKRVFIKTLNLANLKQDDLSFAFLGLAGADMKSDFKLLNEICEEILSPVSFQIINDIWLHLKGNITKGVGVVSIYGTGANVAAINPAGEKVGLRSLKYIHGGYGGGTDMAKRALHQAFRSNEKTGPTTLLETSLPDIFNCNSLEELLDKMYPENKLDKNKYQKIPPLIFDLATAGDQVCQDILIEMGQVQGEMISGVIKSAGLEQLKFPILLGGSVYKGNSPLFINAMKQVVYKVAPKAYFITPNTPPITGAVLYALENINVEINDNIINNLNKTLKAL